MSRSPKINAPKEFCAVIVAAGKGMRAGGEVHKQWQYVAGRSLAYWTVETLVRHPCITAVVLVVDDESTAKQHLCDFSDSLIFTSGGDTRADSVAAGLAAMPENASYVLIHDVARPCVSTKLIDSVIDALSINDAAAPALPVTDALWRADDNYVTDNICRDALYRAQTPQGFRLAAIKAAHAQYNGPAADDVEVARAYGLDVAIVDGDENNLKVTYREDFYRAERILMSDNLNIPDVRTGNGFDVHRFGPGDHVMLCGIKIAHERGLQGHSDADVGLHTITDAIYGALAQGDIGLHFPPSDPRWKGASSDIFLRHACELAMRLGFQITNVDCTLMCEYPKIGPHTLIMRNKLSYLLDISVERISVKATTTEQLGFTGRGEGIACMATVTVIKP